jgi:alpha-1,2-mannosyltransferase
VTNVYGLRLLADVRIQRLALAVLAGVVTTTWLLVLPSFPADQVGYDFRFYWTAASQLLEGQPIYSAQQLAGPYPPQGQLGFLYPPPFAVVAIPFAAAFPTESTAGLPIWSALGALVLAASILALARAERLATRFPLLAGQWVWLLVAAAFVSAPVVAELVYGNVNLFLVGLLTAAWLGLRRGDRLGDAVAGIALGVATLIKIFPGLLLLWLVLRGRGRPVAWAGTAAAALSVAALPATGIEAWTQYPTVLLNMGVPADLSHGLSPATWLAPALGFDTAKLLVWLLVAVVTTWVARWADDRLGFAMVVILALLATPVLWKAYLSILVVPFLLALSAGASPALLGLGYVALSLGYQAALGDAARIVVRLVPSLAPLLVLGALLLRARRTRTGSPA